MPNVKHKQDRKRSGHKFAAKHKKKEQNRRRKAGRDHRPSNPYRKQVPFVIRDPLVWQKAARPKSPNAVTLKVKAPHGETRRSFFVFDQDRSSLRHFYLTIRDLMSLQRCKHEPETSFRESDAFYTGCFNGLWQVCTTFTAVDLRKLSQEFYEDPANKRIEQSKKFWFQWIIGSFIQFKYGSEVAPTFKAYLLNLDTHDRGPDMNLRDFYRRLQQFNHISDCFRSATQVVNEDTYRLSDEQMIEVFYNCLDREEKRRWHRFDMRKAELTYEKLREFLQFLDPEGFQFSVYGRQHDPDMTSSSDDESSGIYSSDSESWIFEM
jgi:hypothetical protein